MARRTCRPSPTREQTLECLRRECPVCGGPIVDAWRSLRAELDRRRQQRVQQHRFLRDPEAYLADLETRLVKPILPP